MTGYFSFYPLGLHCQWQAADGVFDTELTSWPLSVLLTGGLVCVVLGFLAVLVGGLLAVVPVGFARVGTVIRVTGSDQAVSRLPRELRDLVASGPMAHLTTINADGSPQVSVMWIALDGDDVVSAHMGRYAKLRNMERDPRVVLSFDAPREAGVFMNPYAVLRARASIEPSEDAWDLLDRLAKVYISPDAEFPAPKGPGFIVRYSIERIGGVGPWVPSA